MKRGQKYSDQTIQRAIELSKQGHSPKTIADLLDEESSGGDHPSSRQVRRWTQNPPQEISKNATSLERGEKVEVQELPEASEVIPSPVANAAISRHDVEVFERSDGIMNEKEFLGLANHLWHGASYDDKESSRLLEFLTFFNYETNRYAGEKIFETAGEMCEALDNLSKFMWGPPYPFFDTRLSNREIRYRMYRYSDVERSHGIESQADYDKQFQIYADELDKLVEAARLAYREYRIYVRQTLYK
jgi:hypothetical protein